MNNIDVIREFLGWCSVINIGLLTFSTVIIMAARNPVMKIHSSMAGVSEELLPRLYFEYLGNYKIFIIVFNLVPYLALRFFM